MVSILPTLQFSIATGLLLFGIIQLIYQNSTALNHCMAISILSLGYVLFYFWSIDTGFISYIPIIVNSDIPATFFSASGIYLVFTTLLGEKDDPSIHYKRHFIIPILACIGLGLTNIVYSHGTGTMMPVEILTRNQKGNLCLHFFSFFSDLTFLTYISLALVKGIRMIFEKKIQRKSFFRYMFAFLLIIQLLAILFIVVRFIDNPMLIQFGTIFCGLIVLSFCVIGFRYPEYTQRVLKAIGGQNKRTENLEKQDINELMNRLDVLMEKRKIFTDPELSLKDVSDYMDLSPQMVSQLINRKKKMNFKTFINTYRIQAICTQLLAHPDVSILEIAFNNGFNSKSTFNTAFQEITGKTPREYRKSMQKEKITTL